MIASERFSLRPSTEEWRRAWIALESWPDERHREEARFSLEFLAGRAVERNDHAVVSPPDRAHWIWGRRLPPALREELFEALRDTSRDTSPG